MIPMLQMNKVNFREVHSDCTDSDTSGFILKFLAFGESTVSGLTFYYNNWLNLRLFSE